MIEHWSSRDALSVHGKAKALTDLGKELADKPAAPLDVKTFDAVPAGDGKGPLGATGGFQCSTASRTPR